MKIIHHGGANGANGVTGSCHELLLSDGSGILIDCGLFQGDDHSEHGIDSANADKLEIDFPIEHIKDMVVTHVHIDHVGRIPYLLAAGYRGPIYCSRPSAELLPLVIEDAVKVGVTRDKKVVESFLQLIHKQLQPFPYLSWQEILPGVKLKLRRAGHILGSASVELKAEDRHIVFSGDLGAPNAPLLPAPRPPASCDTLVLESTYGNRLHPPRRHREKKLQQVIEKAVADNGVVLIPAFSIGRTQEIVYEIENIIHNARPNPTRERTGGKGRSAVKQNHNPWHNLQIVIDSPLAAKFTNAYRKLKPYWDKEAKKRVKAGRHPLNFEQLHSVDNHETHMQLIEELEKHPRPVVIIAASGMCAGGRIVNYLKALIENPTTDILFSGYQATGTPGREIQKYGPENGWVELDHKKYTINASTHTLPGYSAHADQRNLISYVKNMTKRPSEIILVHGDTEAKLALKKKLEVVKSSPKS